MRVTLDIFSGRPNPTWQLSERQTRQLRERTAVQPGDAAALVAPVAGTQLGFRGVTLSEDRAGEIAPSTSPQQLRIAAVSDRAAAASVAALGTDADIDTVAWLLETARRVPDDLTAAVADQLAALRVGVQARAATEEKAAAPTEVDRNDALAVALEENSCQPYLSPKRFAFWNSPGVQPYNNCYNYATNFASGTLAQPGRRSGQVYSSFHCADIAAAAMRDGVRPSCRGETGVVALGVWPGFDFHWWRLHPDGFWAHKIGWWPAQDRDNSFRPIGDGLTPASCDRGPYSDFCGYFFAPLTMWVA
jgi:hypothetical protein